MVSGHISRARAFGIVSEQRALPYGLLPLAIAVGTQLVAYARDTATSDRERSPPALAKHLNNLAGHLANFGRYDEALVAIREAVNVYRHLAEEPRPLLSSVCRHLPQQSVAAVGGQWRADLAGSLHNLSLCLSNVGRYEEAREAGLEALGYYRQLTGAIAVRFTRNLINVLRILAMIHDALGNHDAASAVRAEADAIEAGHPPTLK